MSHCWSPFFWGFGLTVVVNLVNSGLDAFMFLATLYYLLLSSRSFPDIIGDLLPIGYEERTVRSCFWRLLCLWMATSLVCSSCFGCISFIISLLGDMLPIGSVAVCPSVVVQDSWVASIILASSLHFETVKRKTTMVGEKRQWKSQRIMMIYLSVNFFRCLLASSFFFPLFLPHCSCSFPFLSSLFGWGICTVKISFFFWCTAAVEFFLFSLARACLPYLCSLSLFTEALVTSLSDSVEDIFSCSLQLFLLHAGVTWFAFTFLHLNFAVLASVCSGAMAVLPYLSPAIVSIPASLALYFGGRLENLNEWIRSGRHVKEKSKYEWMDDSFASACSGAMAVLPYLFPAIASITAPLALYLGGRLREERYQNRVNCEWNHSFVSDFLTFETLFISFTLSCSDAMAALPSLSPTIVLASHASYFGGPLGEEQQSEFEWISDSLTYVFRAASISQLPFSFIFLDSASGSLPAIASFASLFEWKN